ncbi:ABC transporter permease [Mycolicibacterium komossense]|uniref:ABC transporter permease n=1 Tax=Mycolicibacterium komossense TaxID=1779 RepID=A0ABT3CH80_9MYCO|nr:ABC transporter permease [Mycolicibacterium komossense]MCV7228820.1 ABC transporter permease [Mycolicibacterium komossense]
MTSTPTLTDAPISAATARRPRPPKRRRTVPTGLIIGVLFLLLVFGFLYAPLITTALFSFNASNVQTWPMQGFTTQWYSDLFADQAMITALLFSLRVALMAVLISAIAGLTFSLIAQRVQFSGKRVLDAVLAIPLVAPGMVLGISLLVVFNLAQVETGFMTLVIGHAAFITPLVMFVLQQRLKTMDPSIEHASMDLGAGRIKTFWHVTLPGVRVSLLAASLLGFTLSMDEIAVSFFLSGTQPTLPVYVWGLLRFGFTPEVNAVFTLIGGFSLLLIGGALVLLLTTARRREKQLVGIGAS